MSFKDCADFVIRFAITAWALRDLPRRVGVEESLAVFATRWDGGSSKTGGRD